MQGSAPFGMFVIIVMTPPDSTGLVTTRSPVSGRSNTHPDLSLKFTAVEVMSTVSPVLVAVCVMRLERPLISAVVDDV